MANSAYICIYITYIYMVTEWRLERHHFCDACCSWTSSADELFLEKIYIWVLLKRAPTSTQFHPPPLSSNQIHPLQPSLFQPPPYSLQHPQQCSNQKIARNFPKFRLKIQSCPFWLKFGSHDILQVVIPNPDLGVWNSNPKTHFWANLSPKS